MRVRQDLAIAESQLRDYQARLGKPFTHEGYLSELAALRDQLKAKLSVTGHEPGEEQGPTAAELAERIKALKASNTIEGTQPRAERKHATAEEPITARIRRRQETHPAPGQAGEHDAMEPADQVQHVEEENSPGRPPMTFQERIILERQRNGEGEGQSPV